MLKPTLLLLALSPLFPVVSEAAPMNPASAAGQVLVQRLANEAAAAFVEQTDALASDDSEAQQKFRSSCEGTKSTLLADLETLELNKSRGLLDAKAALEKIVCPASDEIEYAPASDQKLAHDRFFSATVSLRAVASVSAD